jgi:hypothetical protein
LVGTWDGDLEDFDFNTVTHARLVIAGASSAGICGSITYGTKPAPAPATDPDAPYTLSDSAIANIGPCMFPFAPYECVIEGFPYTIAQGGAHPPMVRLGTFQDEPWQSWCELQTAYDTAFGSACIPRPSDQVAISMSTSDPTAPCTITDAGGTLSYSTFKCVACGVSPSIAALCTCGDGSCAAAQIDTLNYDLTLSDDGKSLSGAFPSMYGATLTVYVTRVDGG